MVLAISWVPKGASKSVPIAAEAPSKEEILEMNGVEIENENKDEYIDVSMSKPDEEIAHAVAVAGALGKGSKSTTTNTECNSTIADALEKLDMDNYDEEDDDVYLFGGAELCNLYYPSNEMDPYLKDQDDDDSDSEDLEEDMTIKPEDAVIVCACNKHDVSHLEAWILEDSGGDSNMYVHHDIILPAPPLCLAWLDCPIKGGVEKGNFMAVGSMDPAIEIWDLDIMDEVQPSAVLGGIVDQKKKKKKNSIKYKDGSHTDSVLSLFWNKEYRNALASGSADNLIKIWDVATQKCSTTIEHHSDKVQAVAWNDHAPKLLLSGSSDHSVVVNDASIPSRTGLQWTFPAGVESLAWDPHTEHSFVVGLENGTVACLDTRATKLQPTFTLHAHDKAVFTVSYNYMIPNFLATGSKDKMVKLWDLSDNQPSCIASKNPKAGALLSVSFSNDCPTLLAMGGYKGKLELWNTLSDAAVSEKYEKYVKQNGNS